VWFIVEWSKVVQRHRVILYDGDGDREAVFKAHPQTHDLGRIEDVIAVEGEGNFLATMHALLGLDVMSGGSVKYFIESLALQFYEAGRKAEREIAAKEVARSRF
jgi:hypothetical protein